MSTFLTKPKQQVQNLFTNYFAKNENESRRKRKEEKEIERIGKKETLITKSS